MKGKLIAAEPRMKRLTIQIDGVMADELVQMSVERADIELTVKRWKERRSRDENAYFHVLASEIAQKVGTDPLTVKKYLVENYGVPVQDSDGDAIIIALPVSVDPDRYYAYTKFLSNAEDANGKPTKLYMLFKRSSDMNTAEMANLIDGAIQEAKKLGIDTDTPQERARKEGYRC